MSDSTGEINKAIRALRRELKDVHGDASCEKQDKVFEILQRLEFHVSAKLLFDSVPEIKCNSLTLQQLTKHT